MDRTRIRVVVVGGGASGVLATLNLARTLGPHAEILLVERSGAPGQGLAFSTRDPNHLLNVRVSNMSAFPDDPDHFFRWLQTHGPAHEVGCPTHVCFVPRKVYGAYLADLFAAALTGPVTALTGTVSDIRHAGAGVAVRLDDGTVLEADAAILATGHDARPARNDGVVDAWSTAVVDGIDRDATVAILGTGLTMVDVVLSLRRAGHRGPVLALSRRGLVPHVHAAAAARPIAAADIPFGGDLSRLTAVIRRMVADAATGGTDWRGVVDGLRPHTRSIWRAMSPGQRGRFLRHARPWWDVHRHRMAPAVAEALADLRADGRLTVLAARVTEVRPLPAGAELAFRRRGADAVERIAVARVIDATGLPTDGTRSSNPAIGALFARGLARLDPLGLGLDLSDDYALVDAQGRASDRLFAVGPLGRGAFWEMIAIPDIRRQCAELADDLAARLGSARPRRSA